MKTDGSQTGRRKKYHRKSVPEKRPKENQNKRRTVEQMRKRALELSYMMHKPPGEIMEQLISEEQNKRRMTPKEKKAADVAIKELQKEPANRQERRRRKAEGESASHLGNTE